MANDVIGIEVKIEPVEGGLAGWDPGAPGADRTVRYVVCAGETAIEVQHAEAPEHLCYDHIQCYHYSSCRGRPLGHEVEPDAEPPRPPLAEAIAAVVTLMVAEKRRAEAGSERPVYQRRVPSLDEMVAEAERMSAEGETIERLRAEADETATRTVAMLQAGQETEERGERC